MGGNDPLTNTYLCTGVEGWYARGTVLRTSQHFFDHYEFRSVWGKKVHSYFLLGGGVIAFL